MSKTTIPLGERLFNKLMTLRSRLGVAPPTLYELDVVGRSSGEVRTTPVTLLEVADKRYLVAPRGEVQWVLNARAAGRVTLRQASSSSDWAVSELADDAKPELLKVYLERFGNAVGQHFPIDGSAELSEFDAIAPRYPVFLLQSE